jgi:flavin-binding protein dodecin
VFYLSVTKSLNIQGISNVSFEDAVKVAFEEVSQSVDHIFDIKILGLNCTIRDNKIHEYIADTKICFKVDTERAKN